MCAVIAVAVAGASGFSVCRKRGRSTLTISALRFISVPTRRAPPPPLSYAHARLGAHNGAAGGRALFPGLPRPVQRIVVLGERDSELADSNKAVQQGCDERGADHLPSERELTVPP
jgi:hypothetical protein